MTVLSRSADIEPAKMLRYCSKVRFGEAAARRGKVRSMSGLGRERQPTSPPEAEMLQGGK